MTPPPSSLLQLIKFSGVAAGEACTVVLRGATGQMIEEADRSLHDALSVLSQTVKETRVVLGGGCAEMAMAVAVDEEAKRTEGKKALAVEAFARALRQVRPRVLRSSTGAWAGVSADHLRLGIWRRSRLSWLTTQDATRPISSPSSGPRTTKAGKTQDWVRPRSDLASIQRASNAD